MEEKMKLGYVILYVENVRSTVEFYERAFELKRKAFHESPDGDYAEMATGDTVLAFASEKLAAQLATDCQSMRADELPPPTELALVTEQVEVAFDHALQNGASEVRKPESKPWGQVVSYVRDLNGCLVEICSPVPATNP